MSELSQFINAPCPLLPPVDRVWQPQDVLKLGRDRSGVFYTASLHYAQSQWQRGLPAQAILQINRALACPLTLDDPALLQHPLPYRAMGWILRQLRDDQFGGNPRRHFQHLATRMVEPNKSLRTWRAWACWYLAKSQLSSQAYPADHDQIRAETVVEPSRPTIASQLEARSPADDLYRWQLALTEAEVPPLHPEVGFQFHSATSDSALLLIQQLAEKIWPTAYTGIISPEQVRYMLDQRYSLAALQADQAAGSRYFFIRHATDPWGYFSYRDEGDFLFLDKLYLLPNYAGQGQGQMALAFLQDEARRQHKQGIQLRVNRNNANAIRAYLRADFTFLEDRCTDIGNGFQMDDYVMQWSC
jgi:GNAT superfamily N-acetyltransferase